MRARLESDANQEGASGMQMQRIVITCAISMLATAAWSEEYRGTFEQQMACTPDVWRLCSDQIPDANRIVGCLRANTPKLSSGCRAVFESQASGAPADSARPAPQAPPRARGAQPVQPQASPRQAPPPASNNGWYQDND